MNVMNLYVYENRSMSNDLSRPLMLENLNVDTVQIHIPKEIDGTDMGTWAWWFVYQNAKREKYSIPLTLEAVTNDEGEEEYISTTGLNHGFTGKHGTVMYAIEAVQADGSGAVTHEWHTRTYKLEIVHTLQGNQTEYSETESDIISALISRVNELIQSGAEIAEIAETIEHAAETAQEVIDSIPSDYSSLSDQVDTNTADISQLKADLGDVTNTEYKLVGLKEGSKALGISFTRGKYRLMTPEANTLKTNSAYAISGSLLVGKRVGVVAITDDYEFAVIWYGDSISLEGRVGYTGWLNGGKFIDVPDGAYQFTYQVHKKDGTAVSTEDVDVIKNFVRFYVPLEINDVTDPTLSQEGKPADALSTGVELEKINTKFETNKLLIPFGFVRGNRTNGNSGEYINTEYISRATSAEKIHFNEKVVFNINPGFRVRRYWFKDGSFESFDGNWKTGTVTFASTLEYYINISRIDEDTEETIDVDEFVSQVWRPIITGNLQPDYKVLAIGDSICKGTRNGSKGFVGDLGYQYVNAGVDGATLSTVRDNTIHWIENQLTAQTDQFEIVLVEGGINDYFYGATLGTLSNKPIRKDVDTEAYAALDLNTTLGGLEHLFSTLINKYPNAHRFFVITHKTRNYPYTAGSGGFTQKELHDAIVSACELYGVSVIDIYEKSVINTYFSEYVSPTDWNSDNSVGETNWVDNDKVHPLAYGYLHGYIPLIQKALIECGYKWILS